MSQSGSSGALSVIKHLIVPSTKSLGEFSVARVLPSRQARNVGPFIFFDEFGPAEFPAGHDLGVRAHPHIGLSTVTYLFEGAIQHKDSLGSDQRITPGAVNWMVAGEGIVHSERTPKDLMEIGQRMHGLQIWMALPKDQEQCAPSFSHHPATSLPHMAERGVHMTLVLGAAYGAVSPVPVASPCFYIDVRLEPGGRLVAPPEFEERACYPVDGEVRVNGEPLAAHHMAIFQPGAPAHIEAAKEARLVLIGGAPLDGPRHLFWNFVASDPALIEAAKQRWQDGGFASVPGEDEFIPLPG